MKKTLLLMMALVAIVLASQAEAATQAKHRALVPAFGGLYGSYTAEYPELFEGDPEVVFDFPAGISIGYLSDYFFGADNEKHAFTFDFYVATGSSEMRVLDEGSDRKLTLSESLSAGGFAWGYRYHFAGASKSTGYLGAGLFYRTVTLQSEDPELGHTGSGGTITQLTAAQQEELEEHPVNAGAGFTLAVTGGYEWRLRSDVVMGLHLMYAPPADYGDIENLGGPTFGYSIGGLVN